MPDPSPAPESTPQATEAPAPVISAATDGSMLGVPAGGETTSGGETASGAETTSGSDTSSGSDSLGAPEAYDLKFPEGSEIAADALASFTTLAKDRGLTNEQAQSFVDLYVSESTKLAERLATDAKAAWDTTLESWKTELSRDPDFSGAKAIVAQTAIGRALDEYGSPEARQAFDLTGAGANPAIIKFVHKMAQALQEGGAVSLGSPAPKGPQTPGQVFYGNSEG